MFSPLSVNQLIDMTLDAGYETPASKKGPPLTPRSAEACSSLGILPSELMPRPLSTFRQKGTSERLQQRRWQHYEDRRQHSLEHVRETRHELIQQGKRKRTQKSGPSTLLRGTAEFSNDGSNTSQNRGKTPGADSTVEIEKKRLARTQARQQAEIEQMLLQEIQRSAIAEQNKRKEERDSERQRKLQVERKNKRNAAEEIRREREKIRAKEMDDMEQKGKNK